MPGIAMGPQGQSGAPAGGKSPQNASSGGGGANPIGGTPSPFALSSMGGMPTGQPTAAPAIAQVPPDFRERMGGMAGKTWSELTGNPSGGFGGGSGVPMLRGPMQTGSPGGWSDAVNRGNGTGYASGAPPLNSSSFDYMRHDLGNSPSGGFSFQPGTPRPPGGPSNDYLPAPTTPTATPLPAPTQTPMPPPGGPPAPGNDPFSRPTSAMDVYRSAVPGMQDALKTNVNSAMADAGFSGNRFGSYAMKTAAEEGARTGLAQNQLMTDLLYRQTNADQDRSLQASNLASQHGQAAERMQLDRMRLLGDLGMWEQGRQDNYGRMAYDDFERNKLGFLPLLTSLAQAPGTSTQGVWGQNQSGGGPGVMDYAAMMAPIIAMAFSDERLKDDIRPLDSVDKVERLTPRAWEWKGSGLTDTGFVAQEVARVAPELVRPMTPQGVLGISIPGMMALSVDAIQKLSKRVRELEAA